MNAMQHDSREGHESSGFDRADAETLCLLALLSESPISARALCGALGLDQAHASELAVTMGSLVRSGMASCEDASFTLTPAGRQWRDDWLATLDIALPVSAPRNST